MIQSIRKIINSIVSKIHFDSKKLKISSERYVAYSLRTIYYFSRFIGLLPFSIIRDRNGDVKEVRVSLFDFLWCSIAVCLYLSMAFICFQTMNLPKKANSTHILVLGDCIHCILGLINAAIMIVMDMCNRFRILNILKKFALFDKQVTTEDFLFVYRYLFLNFQNSVLYSTIK